MLMVVLGVFFFSVKAMAVATQVEGEDYSSSSGVSTETAQDTGGGLNVSRIDNGDWAEYSVDIPDAGSYEFTFRVASNNPGGTIDMVIGGSTIGSATVTNTGGWQTWESVTTTVNFSSAGTQILRLNFTGDAGSLYNVNWFSFDVAPILIEAEGYVSAAGVRTETTQDVGGGSNLGYIEDGDWSEYTVTIPDAGEYRIDFRTASDNQNGGIITILSDQFSIGQITAPFTGGWQTWATTSTYVTFDTSGTKTIRLNYNGGGGSLFNINWFLIQPAEDTLSLTIGNTLQQKMRYGMDYERLWYWTGGLNGTERDSIARWSAVDADVDFIRVAMNSKYELTEGTYDLSAYTSKIIPLMQEMKEANPNLKFFASPRPLNEAESNANWQPYPRWITGQASNGQSFDFNDINCAEYIVRYLILMKSYGFKISFLDVSNEWQSNVFGGRLTQDDMDDIHEYLNVTYLASPWEHPDYPGITLTADDIPEIVAPSSWSYSEGRIWINNLDNGDKAAISIAASHNTGRDGDAQSFADAVRTELGNDTEIWNTEVHGWKSTSSENETTSFYYYLEAIRAGFGGINGWLAIGTTSQGHSYILNPNGTPRRNVKYYIYRKMSSTANYGHALDILDEPDVFNAPLGSDDDDIPRNVAAFIKGNLMTVWVVNENSTEVPLIVSPSGRTIAESVVRRTRWTDPDDVEGFVTSESVDSGSSFRTLIPGESVCCFEIVLDSEDYSNDRIEAESFSHSWGLDTQSTGDVDGDLNLSNIGHDDFTRYGAVALVDNSRMSFRLARPGNRPEGYVEVREGSADGPVLGQVDVPNTGNWQNYQTVYADLNVDAGIYNLYVKFVENAETPTNNSFVNMNWFTVNEPAAVTELAATALSDSEIWLNWDSETTAGATSYDISRSTSPSGGFAVIASGVTATSVTDTGLDPFTTYYYTVTGNFDGQAGPSSEIVSATTLVAGIVAENLDINSVKLGTDAMGGKQITLTVDKSQVGYSYEVYTCDTLLGDDWVAIGGIHQGTGGSLDINILFDYTDPQKERQFFRIKATATSP